MRAGLVPILAALLPAALLLATPAEAHRQANSSANSSASSPARRSHHRTASDMDLTLARMAARDRPYWRVWQQPRPLDRMFAPATRERVAAPPFTGWGYGGTLPGATPGF